MPPTPEQTVYQRLIDDPTLSLGAFKLWHVLRDYAGGVKYECFPSWRTLIKRMRCSKNSVREWTDQLIRGDYLSVQRRGREHSNTYLVLPGRSPATGTSSQSQDGTVAVPVWTRRDPKGGSVTNITEPTPLNQGPAEPWKIERELDRLKREQQRIPCSLVNGGPGIGWQSVPRDPDQADKIARRIGELDRQLKLALVQTSAPSRSLLGGNSCSWGRDLRASHEKGQNENDTYSGNSQRVGDGPGR